MWASLRMSIKARIAAHRSMATRVARRYKEALAGIGVGRTVEMGNVRVHRYRDHFRVTDLTNAGKRGKKVDEATVSPSYAYKGDWDQWFDSTSQALVHYRTFDQVMAFFRDLLASYPGEIEVNRSQARGVDVEPGGLTKITLKTRPNDNGDYMVIESKPTDWGVKSVAIMGRPDGGSFTQDTLYTPAGGKREVAKGAKLFNIWLQENLSKVNGMSILELRKVWDNLKVKYDYH